MFSWLKNIFKPSGNLPEIKTIRPSRPARGPLEVLQDPPKFRPPPFRPEPPTDYTDPKPAFYLYKEQSEQAREWMKKHTNEPPHDGNTYAGAIGGRYTWCFTGTSIGEVVKVKCACGAECDVSDYDNW